MDQSKQPEPRRATTGTRAKSLRHKAILAERFRHARRACWLTVPQAAKLLHVSVRTVHNWEAGIVRVPFAAYKLMRILRGVELPNGCGLLSEAWAGWRFQGDKLISPEGPSGRIRRGGRCWCSVRACSAVRHGKMLTELAKWAQALKAMR